jgi:predicted membrane protein (TIGR00267 family)
MMKFELGLEEPDPKRALRSALTIGGAYVVGGIVPLVPYMALESLTQALWVSVIVTLVTLFAFGYGKGRLSGTGALKSAFRTAAIGGAAAFAAFAIASAIS